MTDGALCKQGDSGRIASLVMTGSARSSFAGLMREYRIGVRVVLVGLMSEADHSSLSVEVQLLDLSGGIVAGDCRIAVALRSGLHRARRSRSADQHRVEASHAELEFHTIPASVSSLRVSPPRSASLLPASPRPSSARRRTL